jgi:hypothetical protein
MRLKGKINPSANWQIACQAEKAEEVSSDVMHTKEEALRKQDTYSSTIRKKTSISKASTTSNQPSYSTLNQSKDNPILSIIRTYPAYREKIQDISNYT